MLHAGLSFRRVISYAIEFLIKKRDLLYQFEKRMQQIVGARHCRDL